MPNYTHEEMNNRIREIQAQSRGRISREEARKQAEAESNYEKPVGQGFQNVEDEVSLGSKAAPEAPSHSIEPRDIRRADEPVPPDPLPEEFGFIEDMDLKANLNPIVPTEGGATQGPQMEGENDFEQSYLQAIREMEEEDGVPLDERRVKTNKELKEDANQKIASEDSYNSPEEVAKREAENKQVDKEADDAIEAETQRQLAENKAASEERLANPNHPGYVNPKDKRDADRLQDILDNLGSGPGISPEDSKWVQKYRAEQAAKKAKVQADKDSGSIRYISDDASETDTRVAGQLSAEDRAREAAGIPVKRKIYPPKAASDGRMLPMITHDPSLTTVIEVFDPPGSDNLVNRIVEDIPGARKELAQRKGAEGKVRMRQAKGGYARAADDEPYSRGDIYMSDSQAGRAESTAENRIREKARRKGLLARNRKLAKGWRDPKSPFAYGKDAAAVRIAQIAADAEKAKAEAAAKIKADDTLNAHQKELAIIKAQGEIDAKAAAARAEVDATEGDKNRKSAEKVAGVEQEQTETVLGQQATIHQITLLQNEMASQEAILTSQNASIEDRAIARKRIKEIREQLSQLSSGEEAPAEAPAGEPAGAPADTGHGNELDGADLNAPANNVMPVKDATEDLKASEPDLFAELNTDAMNLMFTEDSPWSFDETDLVNLYFKLKEFFNSNKIDSANIAAAGVYIYSKLAEFHRETIEEFSYSARETDGTAWRDIYNFFEALKNGNMPPPPEGVPLLEFEHTPSGHSLG